LTESKQVQQLKTVESKPDTAPYYITRRKNDWNVEISEIETWLSTTTLPTTPFRLSVCETIDNIQLFIEVNLLTAKSNNGNPAYRPYLDKIINLKNKLSHE